MWDLVLSVSALCSHNQTARLARLSVRAFIRPVPGTAFSDRTKEGRARVFGTETGLILLAKGKRKKKASSDPWNIINRPPCTFGPGQRITPIMQHVCCRNPPRTRLIQLEEHRARDAGIQYRPGPGHTHQILQHIPAPAAKSVIASARRGMKGSFWCIHARRRGNNTAW